LQSSASGALGLRSMAWSHSLDGGNLSAASSLNSRENSWYSLGSSALICCSPAWIANSVATPRMVHSVSSCHTIKCFSPSVRVDAIMGCD
jgi:hypothetical protein